ncbi:MAG: UDP-glucose 4-epimerase GalE [Gammaproteobacteria bacterium]|nr:UDP-glucose 4-epimerase GalE [Gammaproteobacteria bacterium]MBU1558217.1 UDP-glucose 4-epimerase GalE [Gammaproteobacteria bacterium]MBU1629294.1 UDP-glucose 4-epimerase GalE [Gammaproteobacteria bacterium]MBU1926834.1 UDP-glucose 4-epimerase GalE [Gammaproteobacteria bacterium]MBU2546190.1 UDP-glucose 4-epimerase GalE [Gammaproteobacteria bacterium]
MTKILVVGGAGYIGSHMADLLVKKSYQTTVLDNLSTGYRDSVLDAEFVLGDLSNTVFLNDLFQRYSFDAVMHFSSFIQVGESVIHPAKYYQNNVVNTLNLLNAMVLHDVKRFIFSSSAAVYGNPRYTPIDEKHPCEPINPYGKSKWMVEQILEDYEKAYGLHSVSLRYFNAAGADPEGRLGERHNPETHLIPLLLQTASGRREVFNLYGTDYETKDGTCIRDYIHVCDLVQAHLLALQYLKDKQQSAAFNLGNGEGFSVREVIDVAEQVVGKKLPIKTTARRLGDAAVLVADSSRAKRDLKWKPKYSDLKTIIQHAWLWEQQCSA